MSRLCDGTVAPSSPWERTSYKSHREVPPNHCSHSLQCERTIVLLSP
jgi:hypothetical protein